MYGSVSLTNPGQILQQWNITLDDLSQGWHFSTIVQYQSSKLSADWIDERPAIPLDGYAQLASFGQAAFGKSAISNNQNFARQTGFAIIGGLSGPIGSFDTEQWTMRNSGLTIIATACSLTDGGTSFTVVQGGCTTATLSGGGAYVDQTSSTGTSVTITGSTAPDGTSVMVISRDLGSTQPTGTGSVSLGSSSYFDVQIQGITDGTAKVCITNAAVTSATVMEYAVGTAWVSALPYPPGGTVTGTTICGEIPVSALQGTPIVIGIPTLPSVPEFPFGMALLLGFAVPALLLVRKKFSPLSMELGPENSY
jgi:hypothetical protein